MVNVKCTWCDNRFDVSPHRTKQANLFCSKQCKYAWHATLTGERAGGWNGGKLQVECHYCHRVFACPPNRIRRSSHVYCSRSCMNKGRDCRGPNNPAWKGGQQPFKNRQRAHVRRSMTKVLGELITAEQWHAIIARFDGRCAWCRQLLPLTMDHAVPLSWFGGNDETNIQPLCLRCNTRKKDKTIFFSPDGVAIHIVDLLALAKAVANGTVPLDAVKPNNLFLDHMAGENKQFLNYPGVKVERDFSTSFRA